MHGKILLNTDSAAGLAAASSAGASTTAAVTALGTPASAVASSVANARMAAFDGMATSASASGSPDEILDMDDLEGTAPQTPSKTRTEGDDQDLPEFAVDVKETFNKTQKPATTQKPTTEDPVVEQTPVAPAVPSERDYTKFTAEDAALLKRMPNHIFNAVKARFESAKQLSDDHAQLTARVKQLETGAMPESYLQHPQAFTLTPEYQSAQETLQQADFESQHFTTALQALERGLPYELLEGYDAKGAPVFRTVQPPTDAQGNPLLDTAARTRINSMLHRIELARHDAQKSARQLQQSFAQQHTQRIEEMKRLDAQVFPLFQKPEYAPQIKQTVAQLPAHLRADPVVAEFTAKGLLLVRALQGELATLRKSAQRQVTLAADRQAAGPSPQLLSSAQGGQRTAPKAELDMADWQD